MSSVASAGSRSAFPPSASSVFDHQVAALDVTKIPQSLTEGVGRLRFIAQAGLQIAYSSDLGRLLGLGAERRGKEYSGDDQEVPALKAIHAFSSSKDRRKVYASTTTAGR
jgi:hypothetical protein